MVSTRCNRCHGDWYACECPRLFFHREGCYMLDENDLRGSTADPRLTGRGIERGS